MHVKTSKEYRAMNLEDLSREEYYHLEDIGQLRNFFPEATGLYGDDMSRIDNIGQNGNDGLHYQVIYQNQGASEDFTRPWPHVHSDGYSDKVKKVIEEAYELPKDNMFVDDYIPDSEPVRGHDMINNPSHYEIGDTGIEAIDIIRETLTKEEFIGYCRGNVLKYSIRANKKNGEEDLRKADIYSGWLLGELEE